MTRKKKNAAYTEEDLNFLKRWYKRKSIQQICKHLKRGQSSVRHKATELGLTTPSKTWTEEETKTLVRLWGTMEANDICRIMGKTRSQLICKAHRMSLSGDKKISYNDRGQKVVRVKGVRIYWSPQMIDDLKRLFPVTKNEDMAEHLGISLRTMVRKARELGLTKDPNFVKGINQMALKHMRFTNITHGNSGMIKKGEHRSPATEFKKGIRNNIKQQKQEDETESARISEESNPVCGGTPIQLPLP